LTRRRLLIVTPQFPFPPSWGFGIRVYQLARQLSRGYDVTLLSYIRRDQLGAVPTLEEEIGSVQVVEHDEREGTARRLLQLRCLISAAPFQLREWYSDELQCAVDAVLSESDFSAVLLESSQLASLRFPKAVKVVLDEHNIEYELLDRMQATERSPLRRFYNWTEFRKFRPVEQRAWQRADGVTVTSERERSLVRASVPSADVVVAPNAVDTEHFCPTGRAVTPGSLVFVGLLTYRPNLDAVDFLLNDILPQVESRRDVCVTVVGAGAREDLDRLRRPNVFVTGEVSDVRPFLEEAAVAVVPVRMGGGTRFKVLEALAMGTPVVSTSTGCEGLHVEHDRHLLVADTADAFATSVHALLDDPSRAAALASAGRALMSLEYSWERSASSIRELLDRLVPEH